MESVADRAARAGSVRVLHDGMNWSVQPASKPLIVGPDALDWLHLERDTKAELIKSNPLRRVWRVRLTDRDLFVKEFLAPSAINRLRSVLRGDSALREWRAGKSMETRGVACIHFVALGSVRGRRFLVSDAVSGASLLSDAWTAAETPTRRLRIVEAVARLVSRAHFVGVVHGDDHPRNILIAPRQDGGCAAVYADLYTVRTTARITDTQAVAALAQLNQWFRLNARPGVRLRFLIAYCRATGTLVRNILPNVQQASRQRAFGLWAKRDRRISKANSYFAKRQLADGSRVYLALPGRRANSFPPAALPAMSAEQWDGALSATFRALRGKGPGRWSHAIAEGVETVFFLFRRFGKHWPSAASKRFRNIHRLRNRDIPVPWAHACVERRGVSMLCTDGRGSCVPIGQFFRESRGDIKLRRRACRALARTVARLAEQGTAVAVRGGDIFAYDLGEDAWLIPDASCVTFGGREVSVRRLRWITARAIYESLLSRGTFRKTDGVFLAKCLGRGRWKGEWRGIQSTDISLQEPGFA